MSEYNAAFFHLYENFYRELKKRYAEQGIETWKSVLANSIINAYKKNGGKELGGVDEFIRCVGARDESVGLKVSFEKTADGFIYVFHTDPFPGLRGEADWHEIVDAYLKPKMRYFLGNGWKVATTKHFWKGDGCVEHVFTRVGK